MEQQSYDEYITPRRLTDEEIEFIFKDFPLIPAATKEYRQFATKQFIEETTNMLRTVEIVPAGIDELKKEIIRQYERSFIEPGSSVGILASEALSAPITQMTFNTFHSSGSSKNVSSGLDALREMFRVTDNRSIYGSTIQFKSKDFTYSELFNFRKKIEQVKFMELVTNFDILSNTEENMRPWIKPYLKLSNSEIPETKWFMRLYLNVNMIYAYEIPYSKLIKIIKEPEPPTILVIPSPPSFGIIDIFPDVTSLPSEITDNIDRVTLDFLDNQIIQKLQNVIVSGIKGIEGFYPSKTPIVTIIDEERFYDNDDNSKVFIVLSDFKIRKTGITIEKLESLLEEVGIIIEKHHINGLFVKMPESSIIDGKYQSPTAYILKLLSQDRTEEDKIEDKEVEKGNYGYINPPTPLVRKAYCWNVDTNGRNFAEIIELDEVDPYTSYTNDIHEMYRTLGIEAIRNFIIYEFRNIIEGSGEYINNRHIKLLVDVMTNIGKPTPISYYGSSRLGNSALTLSSFEQCMKVYSLSAAYGSTEKRGTLAYAIMTGNRMGLGSGAVHIIEKVSNKLEKEKIIVENVAQKESHEEDFEMDDYETENFLNELVSTGNVDNNIHELTKEQAKLAYAGYDDGYSNMIERKIIKVKTKELTKEPSVVVQEPPEIDRNIEITAPLQEIVNEYKEISVIEDKGQTPLQVTSEKEEKDKTPTYVENNPPGKIEVKEIKETKRPSKLIINKPSKIMTKEVEEPKKEPVIIEETKSEIDKEEKPKEKKKTIKISKPPKQEKPEQEEPKEKKKTIKISKPPEQEEPEQEETQQPIKKIQVKRKGTGLLQERLKQLTKKEED